MAAVNGVLFAAMAAALQSEVDLGLHRLHERPRQVERTLGIKKNITRFMDPNVPVIDKDDPENEKNEEWFTKAKEYEDGSISVKVYGDEQWQTHPSWQTPAQKSIALTSFLCGILLICFVGFAAFRAVRRAEGKERPQTILKIINSLFLLWAFLLTLGLLVCFLSVMRAQGYMKMTEQYYDPNDYKIATKNYMTMKTYRPNKDKFVYDGYFISGSIVASIGLVGLVGTWLYKRYYLPSRSYQQVQPVTSNETRYPELDAVKYPLLLLIFMVHFLQDGPYQRSTFTKGIFVFTSASVLPTFIFCSGFNASDLATGPIPRRIKRVFVYLFAYFWTQVCFVFFLYFIYTPIVYALHNDHAYAQKTFLNEQLFPCCPPPDKVTFLSFFHCVFGPPKFVNWYLQSLFAWSAMAIFWVHLEAPITMSILVMLLALYLQDSYFETPRDGGLPMNPGRTFEYFPFFIAGICIKHWGWHHKFLAYGREYFTFLVGSVVLLLYGAFSAALPFQTEMYTVIIFPGGFNLKSKVGDYYFQWAIGKIIATAFSMVLVVMFLAVIVKGNSYMSRAGRQSIAPFLLHYPIYLIFRAFGYLEGFNADYHPFSPGDYYAHMILAYVLCFFWFGVLCHPPIAKRLRFLVMPPFFALCFSKRKVEKKSKANSYLVPSDLTRPSTVPSLSTPRTAYAPTTPRSYAPTTPRGA